MAITALSANPGIEIQGLTAVWFDANSDFWIAYVPVYTEPGVFEDMRTLTFWTDSGSFMLPESFEPVFIPASNYVEVNLNQEIPGFCINRQSDSFAITNGNIPAYPLRWGLDSSPNIQLRPLGEGQVAEPAVYIVSEFGGYMCWTKVNRTGADGFISKCIIDIRVRDDQGHSTLQNYPVQMLFHEFQNTIEIDYSTDESGDFRFHNYATLHHLRIKDPVSGELLSEQLIYPEPGDSLTLDVIVPCSHSQDNINGFMELRPNLLNRNSSNSVNISYDKYWLLGTGTQVNLYDLRGRKLLSSPFPLNGLLDWSLPRLSNGIYFVTLTESGKQLARQRLTIIK